MCWVVENPLQLKNSVTNIYSKISKQREATHLRFKMVLALGKSFKEEMNQLSAASKTTCLSGGNPPKCDAAQWSVSWGSGNAAAMLLTLFAALQQVCFTWSVTSGSSHHS